MKFEKNNFSSDCKTTMAHRLISHHRAFFSPRHLAGVSQYISTTAARNYEVKDYFEFKEKVLKSEKPVLVDFHAT